MRALKKCDVNNKIQRRVESNIGIIFFFNYIHKHYFDIRIIFVLFLVSRNLVMRPYRYIDSAYADVYQTDECVLHEI